MLIAKFLSTITILSSLLGLVGGLTLEKFLLAVLAPLTPAFVLGLRQYTEHNEAAARLDKLRENAEILLQKAISKKQSHDLVAVDLIKQSYNLFKLAEVKIHMSTIEEIEAAILTLPPEDFEYLRQWFFDLDYQRWDEQLEQDIADGKLEALAQEAIAELKAGQCREM
jgi:hypothetical protein